MIAIRKSEERGRTKLDWLDSRHTFSFGNYRDARNVGFRHLRVMNEDRVQPGRGFPSHSHQDMEIVTYVLEGALEHKDSLDNGSVIRPGEVQRMSAGLASSFPNQHRVIVRGLHFVQEDTPDEIGRAIAGWLERIGFQGKQLCHWH
jgi:quercetin 2,3-dioxygenase